VTAPLSITTLSGHVGTPLILNTSGGFAGGTITFAADDGTATDCEVAGHSLGASSAGTCIVTASEAADSANASVSSSPTTITFAAKVAIVPPGPVTVIFAAKSGTLSDTAETILQALVKKLATGDSVTCTGYAKDNAALANRRATAVANYLSHRIKLHLTIKRVTDLRANKTTVTTT